ncbi:MAG: WGR domain-containing protein [Verrucomicrobia bacterium]|nr:WGR domain-containing protein [Verrucomicrobiota bacterium]
MPTPIPTTTLNSTSLYFREGNSDKEYHAAIEPRGDGYIVTFAYGRRGSTLTTGTKTTAPVSMAEATKVFDKLVASKVAKGYRPIANTNAPVYQQTGNEGADTGIRCQLLNPVDGTELERLLDDDRHCLQQKHDGRRLLVHKQGLRITGINRRGLETSIPGPIRDAVAAIGHDLLIDGEAAGDTLHAFDLLELGGTDLRPTGYLDRYHSLLALCGDSLPGINVVATTVDPADKRRMFGNCRDTGCEGVVLKRMDAPFAPGRPASGGPQLKYKFVEAASFIVTGINAKRSVTLGLHDGAKQVSAGNVTIPPNHAIPQLGTVVDVKYLYAFRESGAIYQPVYLGPRADIPAAECVTDQLKYKPDGQ